MIGVSACMSVPLVLRQFETMIAKTIAKTTTCKATKSREGTSSRVIPGPAAMSVPSLVTDVQSERTSCSVRRSYWDDCRSGRYCHEHYRIPTLLLSDKTSQTVRRWRESRP